jgi:hypothetical protein
MPSPPAHRERKNFGKTILVFAIAAYKPGYAIQASIFNLRIACTQSGETTP